MRKKSVAVLDIGSSKIEAVIGERGINKTFTIKARNAFSFDGFCDGEFLNIEELKGVFKSCAEYIKRSSGERVETIYVGVPGDFTKIVVKDAQISFPKKKRINEEDVETLFDSAFSIKSSKYKLINRSAIVYELDDYRRLYYPVGTYSEVLKGKLSFVVCTKYFIDLIEPVLNNCGFSNVEFTSTSLAESMYLIDADTRDRIVMLLDVGYITTTFTLLQGDGIFYQNSFNFGGGYITGAITEKFGISFDDADKLKNRVNICREISEGIDLVTLDNGDRYNADEAKTVIKNCLDILCESVTECIASSGFNIPDYVPIYLTGGGITYLRGAKEHVANRLGARIEVVAPKVPMMDSPSDSSLLSLLDLALEQKLAF